MEAADAPLIFSCIVYVHIDAHTLEEEGSS
jgi:hypothetical protein